MAKRVLVLYPRFFDYYHLKALKNTLPCEFDFEDFQLGDIVRQGYAPDQSSGLDQEHINAILRHTEQYDGIIGTHDYPGTLVASLCAEKWNFSFPSVTSILACQHKYYFRQVLQQEVPEATPHFQLLDTEAESFPLFLKPIKSSFSRHAQLVDDANALKALLKQGVFDPSYLSFFNELFEEYMGIQCDANAYIAEGVLTGVQVSLEGYVYQGQVTILGVVDAHLHEGTLSFERFFYPSQLPASVQHRMGTIATRAVQALQLDATLFSVELMYDQREETISIIEINPRISAQFADFFEHVHGVNTYEILVALALGHEPPLLEQGNYSYAASFPLRLFEDKHVTRIPTEQELNQLHQLIPDMILTVLPKEGQYLSELQQDGSSYLYAFVNLAGNSLKELEQKRAALITVLDTSLIFA